VGSQSDRFWVGSTMSTREQLEPDRLLPPYRQVGVLFKPADTTVEASMMAAALEDELAAAEGAQRCLPTHISEEE
jgi:hypothetical protein